MKVSHGNGGYPISCCFCPQRVATVPKPSIRLVAERR